MPRCVATLLLLAACGSPPTIEPQPQATVSLADWAVVNGNVLTCQVKDVIPGQNILSDTEILCVWTCTAWTDGSKGYVQVWFRNVDDEWTVQQATTHSPCAR